MAWNSINVLSLQKFIEEKRYVFKKGEVRTTYTTLTQNELYDRKYIDATNFGGTLNSLEVTSPSSRKSH